MEPQAKTAERKWSGVLTYRVQQCDWVIVGWNFLMIGLFDWGKIQRPVLALVAPILLFLTLLVTGELAESKRGHIFWLVLAVSIGWYLVAQYFWH